MFNLHTIRSQIEMYKVHHLGKVPAMATFAAQMTTPTNVNGTTTGTNAGFTARISRANPCEPVQRQQHVGCGRHGGTGADRSGWDHGGLAVMTPERQFLSQQ